MKNKYVWIIDYDGSISTEGYDSEEKAMERLEKQEYEQVIGYLFVDEQKRYAKIRCVKIV